MTNPAPYPAAEPSRPDGPAGSLPEWWRRYRWILLGVAVSLPFHLSLLVWLAAVVIEQPEQGGSSINGIEIALLPEVELDRTADLAVPESALPMVESSQGESDPLDLPDTPIAGGTSGTDSGDGLLATGAGEGAGGLGAGPGTGTGRGDPGLGTGSGGTSFFGLRARGTRFGYVIDKSGSMSSDGRWVRLGDELLRSLHELPEQASFAVAFFDTSPRVFPPEGQAWERARRSGIERFIRWAKALSPGGGTEPIYGFNHLLSLDVPPDAIFFMTDGEIPPEQGSAILARVLRRARPIAVHCVLFEDRGPREGSDALRADADREIDARLLTRPETGDMDRLVGIALAVRSDGTPPDLMRAIQDRLNHRIMKLLAQETGGAFRVVPVGGGP